MTRPINGSTPDTRTEKRRLGDMGEGFACEYLRRRGFEILEKNYLRKWGEIDIVARKGGMMRFVEVKSVSYATPDQAPETRFGQGATLTKSLTKTSSVSREINGKILTQSAGLRPEENMHPGKLVRLARTMQSYMLEKNLGCPFQLDLITVKIDLKSRKAQVEMIENIII